MRPERIQFALDNRALLVEFDVDQIHRGGVLHVDRDGDVITIHPHPGPTTQPYKIVDVTRVQPEGYRLVSLLSKPRVWIDLATRIVSATSGAVTLAQATARLQQVATSIPFDDLHDLKGVPDSAIGRIENVVDRLDLIQTIRQPNVGVPLQFHYRGLVAYLLLTCFDLLGQNADWIEFGSWLKSRRHEAERRTALTSWDGDPIAAAAQLLAKHNETYGVHRAFRRFIDRTLPTEARRSLMASIEIARYVAPPLPGENDPPVLVDDGKKAEWLFALRNGYTHHARYVQGAHDEMIPIDMRGDDERWYMDDDVREKTITRYTVTRWPKILEETVRAGLAAYVSSPG